MKKLRNEGTKRRRDEEIKERRDEEMKKMRKEIEKKKKKRAGSNSWMNEPTDRTTGACVQIDARGSSWAPLFVHLVQPSFYTPLLRTTSANAATEGYI